MSRLFPALMAIAFAFTATTATDTVDIDIDQNTATASIQVSTVFSVDFSLTFEQVSGLTAQNLGLSAGLINPTNTALLARLPQSVSIPSAFPVLIAVEPPSTGSLAFHGVVAISLHTSNLSWTQGTPLRLFAAPLGGTFVDITSSTGSGSYRAGANKPGFSEFIVVADVRSVDTVIAAKFTALQSKLNQFAQSIPSSLVSSLQAQLDAAHASYVANEPGDAADTIDAFAAAVLEHSDTDIPDLWRASRDVSNVAGELRSAASTLSYSLELKANSGS